MLFRNPPGVVRIPTGHVSDSSRHTTQCFASCIRRRSVCRERVWLNVLPFFRFQRHVARKVSGWVQSGRACQTVTHRPCIQQRIPIRGLRWTMGGMPRVVIIGRVAFQATTIKGCLSSDVITVVRGHLFSARHFFKKYDKPTRLFQNILVLLYLGDIDCEPSIMPQWQTEAFSH